MHQTPSEMLNAYLRAFETLRPEEVAPFYALPCTCIGPDTTSVVADHAAALALAGHLIAHAKGQHYRRTEMPSLTIRTLAPGLAELTGVFVRYDVSESEIGRFGFTYIVRAGSGGWRIVVAVAHDVGTESIALSPPAGP